MNDEPNLSAREAESLQKLQQPVEPPASLYVSVANRLKAQEIVQQPMRRHKSPAFGIAAALIAFVVGLKVGEGRAAEPARPAGTDYLVLLMNSPAPRLDSARAADEVVAEYVAWSRALASQGRLAVAEELVPQRFIVSRDSVRAGSLADGADGVFVIRAPNLDSAYAIARTLPHVRQGGSVSVQPVVSR